MYIRVFLSKGAADWREQSMENEKPCPCCSGMNYSVCCEPFHKGNLPENALQLMRSRYSAYALNIPDYIIATTHPLNPKYSEDQLSWKQSVIHFSQSSSFLKLEILDFTENQNMATVTFTASISQSGRDASFTEKSYFEKVNNHWLYLEGHGAS